MNTHYRSALRALLAGALTLTAQIASGQSLTFSAGTGCGGATSATFTPGGSAITVSVCATAPASTCGATIQVQSTVSQSNTFQLTGRTRGAAFDTDNAISYSFGAGTITNPLNTQDLGATNGTPVAAASGVVVATLSITPPAVAPDSSYVISLAGLSSLTTTSTTCAEAIEAESTGATFTFNKAVAPATAQFTISGPVNVTEGGATGTATVSCTGALDSNNTPITVPYTLTGAAGNFTVSPASPLTFNSCPSTQALTVTPRAEDTTIQGAVSGSIVLGTPSGGSLGTPSSSTVNVADNDALPSVSVAASGTCAEPSTNCSFTVTATSNTTPPQTGAGPSVPFTLGGTATNTADYKLVLGTDCAAAAAASPVATTFGTPTVYTVCVVDDASPEPTETVTFTLTAGAGYTLGTASASVNITDDDGPQTVTIAVAPASVAENSGTPLVYTVTRSGGSTAQQAAPLTVNLTGPATSSRYSTTCASTITIAGGATTATCSVTPIDNATVDGSVTAVVSIAASAAYTTGSPASATGTITDDDVAVQAVAGATGTAANSSVVEGGLVVFSVACPVNPTPTTFNYTVTPALTTGDAFTTGSSSGSVTCPAAGGNVVAVEIQTINDTTIGNNRTYTFTISEPPPAPGAVVITRASATFAVLDNDQPTQIPTLGAFGLGLMGLLIAGFGALVQRRRKA